MLAADLFALFQGLGRTHLDAVLDTLFGRHDLGAIDRRVIGNRWQIALLGKRAACKQQRSGNARQKAVFHDPYLTSIPL